MVKDYTDGTDIFDFSGHSAVTDFSDLVVTQSGDHKIITLASGGAEQITLADTLATEIDNGDFLF